eukprot:CAMPEP_0176025328 /NCGR_PEP_ID=MMETSP0120_2-20121206/12389_1 /TAXON_ID=160619 /ORGANISM="Kryptoperidinium foliaceum, Strain CCMP 1326" /LENGTH=301 /DNA_ID=CAMNT_0017358511 /DNA_START=215 /DNA_END=1121 /DNA_ORIENTATION=-
MADEVMRTCTPTFLRMEFFVDTMRHARESEPCDSYARNLLNGIASPPHEAVRIRPGWRSASIDNHAGRVHSCVRERLRSLREAHIDADEVDKDELAEELELIRAAGNLTAGDSKLRGWCISALNVVLGIAFSLDELDVPSTPDPLNGEVNKDPPPRPSVMVDAMQERCGEAFVQNACIVSNVRRYRLSPKPIACHQAVAHILHCASHRMELGDPLGAPVSALQSIFQRCLSDESMDTTSEQFKAYLSEVDVALQRAGEANLSKTETYAQIIAPCMGMLRDSLLGLPVVASIDARASDFGQP